MISAAQNRVHLLSYGVPSHGEWHNQEPWIQRRFSDFIGSVRADVAAAPEWEKLEPPSAPEHVIACLLCAIGSVPPSEEWRAGFEDEVAYWLTAGVTQRLRWEQHKDIEAIRSFLTDTGAVSRRKEANS